LGRPLHGPSPALIIVSVSTPLLRFFQGKCCTYPFGKKKGAIFGMEAVVVNADACKQTRVALLASARAMVTFFNAFYQTTLNCFPQKFGPIKHHIKTR
jgi:hypothetical protein